MEGEFGFENKLHLACALGDKQMLVELIENGADIRAVIGLQDRQCTLLHIAAEYSQVSILKFLLTTEAAVEHILTKDHEGDTPIHVASASATGNIEVFELLYDKLLHWHPDMNVDQLLNKKNRTLLHYAAGKGHLEVVKSLLGKGASKIACDSYGATPFHFAARCGSVFVMELLMGDDVDLENKEGRTALHYASWNGKNEAVRWLLERGASVSKADANGDTALHWAARSETSEVLYTLMEQDADVFAKNKAGQSPFTLAFYKPKGDSNAKIVKRIRTAMEKSEFLPRYRHSIYMSRSKDGATLLHYAAAYGEKEDVEWFFNQARMVTVRKKDGMNSNFEAIVNSKDNNGNNLFHWAAINGNSPVMEALRSEKVNPLAKNKEDRTPLLLALINNHLGFARNLRISLGKDLTDEMWMEEIDMWTDTFVDESLIRTFKFHMTKYIFMPGGLQDKDIKKEMPFIYKALYGKQKGIAKFIQKNSNSVNKAGKLTGRTALHWATILSQKEIVFKLCKVKHYSNQLVAFVADKEGKTPLDYVTEGEILRELMKRPDVKSYAHKHYKDTERYVSACNAILVSAALIVSVTFAGWLHPPWNESFQYANRHQALRMFWIFNGSAFFFAIATVVATASALIPAPYEGLHDGVTSIRKSLNHAAVLLGISIVFVFCAFAAAGFVVLPRLSWYHKCLVWGIVLGGLLCLYYIWRSFDGLYKVYFSPSCAEAQPAKSELQKGTPSSPQSDGPHRYELGTRHEYLPWDDGLDNSNGA